MNQATQTVAYHNVGGAVSVGGEDLYALLKAQELAASRTWRPNKVYTVYATADCFITVNGDTNQIPIFADVPFSGNASLHSLILVTAGITYSFAVEY